ncbi:cell division protein FtsZ [Candidatus Sumerlaeota bacterium]|nr:cell division protein FtsZ [Candidatus Sumerlaeota bacterium]
MAEFEFEDQDEKENRMDLRIKVIGVGGAGTNAVDSMIDLGLENVDFYVINTDVQALRRSQCPNKLQIGKDITHGRGAGSDPIIGEKAALAAKDTINEIVMGADMLFLAAGFGGGTGTGATPVVAEIARELGVLTVAFITRPFHFEGPQRMKRADLGIDRMRECCDTLVAISNERLLEVVGNKATLTEAFGMANEVLAQAVKSISELITVTGLINVDFGDVKAVMSGNGGAVMGVGVGKGENRAIEAVKKACSNPLLDKIMIDGATSILLCISGAENLKLDEINQAATAVYEAADPNANITIGVVLDPNLNDQIKVTIIATGFQDERRQMESKPAQEELTQAERQASPAPVAKPTQQQPVTLKEKLESMLAAESDESQEEKRPQKPFKSEEKVKREEEQQQDFVVNFNRPDNPLRRLRAESSAKKEEKSPVEEDLESPAFLRRRKSLFE